MKHRSPIVSAIAIAAAVQCSRPADTVLDCSASEIRHVLRIRANELQVDDLSFTPAKVGDAHISDAEYVLRFLDRRDNYTLLFRIDRSTLKGTRELFDDEEQAIRGHGGFDVLTCAPRSGAR